MIAAGSYLNHNFGKSNIEKISEGEIMENATKAASGLVYLAGNEVAFENTRHDMNNQMVFGTFFTCA